MNGLGNDTSRDAKESSPIETAIDQIHRELEQLQDCVTALYERLSSTITPEQVKKAQEGPVAKVAKAPETSPLLASIAEACVKINNQRHRISDILTRSQI